MVNLMEQLVSLDPDPVETREWLESLDSVVRVEGTGRARQLLDYLDERARELGVSKQSLPLSAYRNTISLSKQAPHPGNIEIEERLVAINRWNALAMVTRANRAHGELGGHIASYASAAEIFETGFNHFFKTNNDGRGDLVYFQPHSAPGVYARAFLEGRLSVEHLSNFRREVGGSGLSSYPHPWLMPKFWQFPTGSMGIGPINAVYQARFIRYLAHRNLVEDTGRRVWGIFGDGEMDEPESLGSLSLAARENLDNLIFVINCNLQRLDGPVRGNGQIIQELECTFKGFGWNVIKVLWGSDWDHLFALDKDHVLLRKLAATVDGAYQTLGAKDGAYNKSHFFDTSAELQALVSHMSVDEIHALRRGGHDLRKLYAAFKVAVDHKGAPTVILAKTKKGYGMGLAGESKMTSHQQKKLDTDALHEFRNRFDLPLSDQQVEDLEFYRPAQDSPELEYLRQRRRALGGDLPKRTFAFEPIVVPDIVKFAGFALEANNRSMSTTMAFSRMLSNILRDECIGSRIVPIVADEARTFGMAGLFRQVGIYSPHGQRYEAEDQDTLLAYRESIDGQLLEEGINEAGAISSWTAAATAYSTHGDAMLPFYIFYSMFGFQRVGDLVWAAADQRARGFLIGATSGRTSLGGEGLQHQDGSSHLLASTVPNCRAYDPAFAYELAVILDHGMRRLVGHGDDVFYYVTVTNDNYEQPDLKTDWEDGIIRGMYLYRRRLNNSTAKIRLLGSGAILLEVIAAGDLLLNDWGISSEIWSVTSFSELARDAQKVHRKNRLNPTGKQVRSHVETCMAGAVPVIAATDYVRAYAQLIAPYLTGRFTVLGTDGFGRSDTREQLRRFFEVDRFSICIAALHTLAADGEVGPEFPALAIEKYQVPTTANAPWEG